MIKAFRAVKNLILLNKRLAENRARQEEEGYSIMFENIGRERYITYCENNREAVIQANFTMFNDVVLYVDSFRKWDTPRGEVLTSFDFRKVLNRLVNYFSCWGDVILDYSRLLDNEDLKATLTEQGIEFVESENGTLHYSVDAETFRNRIKIRSD